MGESTTLLGSLTQLGTFFGEQVMRTNTGFSISGPSHQVNGTHSSMHSRFINRTRIEPSDPSNKLS